MGERELVVAARGPLQLQTWGGKSTGREREQLCEPTGHGTLGLTDATALAPGQLTSPHLGVAAPCRDHQAPRVGQPEASTGAGNLRGKLDGLGLHARHSPVTPKLQASRVALCEVVTLTSRQSSSRDQLLAWATYCLVAVMYASGTNRPPRHTWMFCGKQQPGEERARLSPQVGLGPCLPPAPAARLLLPPTPRLLRSGCHHL